MIKNTKLTKAVTAIVGVATAFVLAVPSASAQTTADLQAQIQALLAQIATLQAQLGGGSSTSGLYCSFSFTRDLSVGATGADVMDLQKFLNSAGFTVAASGVGSAGMETSYYGSLTAQAVSKFQQAHAAEILAPLGLTSGTGYFGASSRAKARMLCDSTPAPTPGDDDDDDSGSGSGDLSGGEGDITVTRGTVSGGSMSEGESDEVFSFEVEAEDSDVEVQRIEISFENDETSGAQEKPWRVFQSVSLEVDGDEIASMDVDSSSDWSEVTGTVSGSATNDEYKVRFTGLDYVIEEDEEVEFVVVVTAQDNLDSNDDDETWNVQLTTDAVRAVDGVGINNYAPSSSLLDTFEVESSSVTFDFSASSDNPDSSPIVVSTTTKTNKVGILVFDAEAEDGAVMVEDAVITLTTSDTIADVFATLYLYMDGELVGTESVSSGTVTFDNIDLEISEGDHEFEVKADLDASQNAYADGTTISATADASAWDVEAKGSGDSVTVSTDATGNTHYLYTTTPGIVVSSTSIAKTSSIGTNVTAEQATATIKFDVTAYGQDIYIVNATNEYDTDTNDGVVYQVNPNTGTQPTASAVLTAGSNATLQSGSTTWKVNKGNTATFTLTVNLTQASNAGFANVSLEAVEWALSNTDATNGAHVTYRFFDEDDKTDNVYLDFI